MKRVRDNNMEDPVANDSISALKIWVGRPITFIFAVIWYEMNLSI